MNAKSLQQRSEVLEIPSELSRQEGQGIKIRRQEMLLCITQKQWM